MSTLKTSKENLPNISTIPMGSKNQFRPVESIGEGLDSSRWHRESESPLEKSEILAIFWPKNATSGPLRPMNHAIWPGIWILEEKLH